MASRRSKRSSKKTRASIRERIESVDWPTVRKGAMAASWVLGVAGLVIGWMLGVPRLEAYVIEHESPESVEVVFPGAPQWMSGDLEAQLVLTAKGQLRSNVLDRADLVKVREVLMHTGWFERIDQVTRTASSSVEVRAAFVRPYALIRDRQADHLVDPAGTLLPRSYPIGAKDAFIVIINPRYDRPQRVGRHWEGGDITAALRLTRVLEEQSWRSQVKAIDVGAYNGTGVLTIVTDRGSRILWGSPPGDAQPAETLTEQKLRFLAHNVDRHGHIDRNHSGTLDITVPVAQLQH